MLDRETFIKRGREVEKKRERERKYTLSVYFLFAAFEKSQTFLSKDKILC